MSQEHNSELDVLLKKMAKESPQDLNTFVKEACQEDPSLWARLKLTYAEKQQDTSGHSAEPDWSSLESQLEPGDTVGPYVIANLLGEGGMGQVFKAEQQEPIKRTVALKIIKAGMSSRQVLKRFQMEQQTLATMSHPYIAQVYDAGVTPDRRPYFVMEMIEGQPLSEFCDNRKLDIKARLELFGKVCDAVRYAHQRGIVHRDLKPANILVSEKEDKFVPKVIDFGIAKALDAGQEEGQTRLTAVGTTMGSPGYMSPEQAQTNENEIDTRSDVYALGVILYELMTGFLPISPDQWRLKSLSEMLEIILHKPAPKPSELLKASREQLNEILPNRQTTFNKLHRELKGDLDWIILKAVEKDKNRRYSTAAEFQTDIEDYLKGMPVSAGPPGMGYQVKKLVQRHKLPVAAAALLLVTLIVGIVGTTTGFIKAQEEATKANQTLDLMKELLLSPKPSKKGHELKVTELIDDFTVKLDENVDISPETKADLQQILGNTYLGLGIYDQAEELLYKAKQNLENLNKKETAIHLDILKNISTLHYDKSDYQESVRLMEIVVPSMEKLHGSKASKTLAAYVSLGKSYYAIKDYNKAEKTFNKILSQRNIKNVNPSLYHNMLLNLSLIETRKRNYKAAIHQKEQLIDYYKNINNGKNFKYIELLQSLANDYYTISQNKKTLEIEKKVIELSNEVYGPDHPFTLTALNNFAVTNHRLGNSEISLKILEDVWIKKCKVYGEISLDALRGLKNLIRCYLETNSPNKSLDLLQTYWEQIEAGEITDDILIIDGKRLGALVLQSLNKKAESKNTLSQLLPKSRTSLGPTHRLTLAVQQDLAHLYIDNDDHENFISVFLDCHKKFQSTFGPTNTLTLNVLKISVDYCISNNLPSLKNRTITTIKSQYQEDYTHNPTIYKKLTAYIDNTYPGNTPEHKQQSERQ